MLVKHFPMLDSQNVKDRGAVEWIPNEYIGIITTAVIVN